MTRLRDCRPPLCGQRSRFGGWKRPSSFLSSPTMIDMVSAFSIKQVRVVLVVSRHTCRCDNRVCDAGPGDGLLVRGVAVYFRGVRAAVQEAAHHEHHLPAGPSWAVRSFAARVCVCRWL
jgi:hypothetical protein